MPRLFFALPPRPDEAAAMAAAAAPVLQELGGRPVLPDDLHLTLCFLGQVHHDQLAPLIRVTGERVRRGPIRLEFDRLEYWGHAQLVCLVPAIQGKVHMVVADLAEALRQVANPVGELKAFRPHVTVARRVPVRTGTGSTWPRPLPVPVSLTADGFVLMRSDAGTPGRRYAVEHAWQALRGAD